MPRMNTVVAGVMLVAVAAAQDAPRPQVAALAPVIDPAIKEAVEKVSAGEIERIVRRLAAFGTRHTLSTTEDAERGVGAARRWIKEQMEEIAAASGGRLTVAFEEHEVPSGRRVPDGAKVVNVVATLAGRDPRRRVIVSGHYDSMPSSVMDAASDAPGANDDASGTAVVIEAARAMAHLEPRATVVFLCVAGEEQGLLGAAGHAQAAAAQDLDVLAMITNDIVGGVVGSSGRREPWRLRLFSEGVPSGPLNEQGRVRLRVTGSDNDAPSRQLARYLKARGETYVPGFHVTLVFRQDRFLRGGDHKPFNEAGYAAVRFTEPHENYAWQHQDVRVVDGVQHGDLPENLDFDFVARVGRTNVAGIAELALAPASPRQVRVVVSGLTPHTELRWEASDDPAVAGYGVLYRETFEPTWTRRVIVPATSTSALLEGVSKDDFCFAVESFDAAGRRSLPVFPTPSAR